MHKIFQQAERLFFQTLAEMLELSVDDIRAIYTNCLTETIKKETNDSVH